MAIFIDKAKAKSQSILSDAIAPFSFPLYCLCIPLNRLSSTTKPSNGCGIEALHQPPTNLVQSHHQSLCSRLHCIFGGGEEFDLRSGATHQISMCSSHQSDSICY